MIYKIKLTPVTPYFFGIEQVSELGNKRSYYVKSALFPQQTTVLGMLRYQLLAQKGILSPKNNDEYVEVEKIVGAKSFTSNNEKGYGYIKCISPLQLSQKGTIFWYRDREYTMSEKELKKLSLESPQEKEVDFSTSLLGMTKDLVLLKYNDGEGVKRWIEKDGFVSIMTSCQDDTIYHLDTLFHEPSRVGIEKSWEGETKSNAYYKQFFKELTELQPISKINGGDIKATPELLAKKKIKSGWEFCFEAEIDNKFILDCTDRFVSMGGEQSQFIMSAEPLERKSELTDVNDDKLPDLDSNEVYKLLLISDTYIDDEKSFYHYPFFVNAEIVRFRNFVSDVRKTENYTVRGERKKGFTQSFASYLLKKGSVFYFRERKSLNGAIQQIKEQKAFRDIGYNYYIIEKEIINNK